jgi:hypothetical protein
VLIDRFLPTFDAVESHMTIVSAPIDDVWAAIRTADFGSNGIVRALFAIRGMPAFLTAPREALARARTPVHAPLTLDAALTHGFIVLAEDQGRELLLGTAGRFWGARGALCHIDPDLFMVFDEPGAAKAAWNFAVRPLVGDKTVLTTETRVRCVDPAGRWRFRLYWMLIRPFSGLIRLVMLRAIKRDAERKQTRGSTVSG